MGYDRSAQAGLLRIAFEADELDGLVIVYRRPTVGALAAVIALDDFDPVDWDEAVSPVELVKLRPLCEEFAGLIVAWTLEEDGKSVAPSGAAFLGMDAKFVLAVSKTWARITYGLPQLAPVPVEPPIESSIPMEPLAS